MSSFNEATIIGRLGKDPEVRNTTSGMKIVNLRVATSESWTKDGEKQERTEWHTISVMNDRLAEVAEKYLRKGSLAMFRGKIQTRKWQASDGSDKYSTEIVLGRFNSELVLLSPRDPSDASDRHQTTARGTSGSGAVPAGRGTGGGGWDDLDDAVPFGPEMR